MPLTIFSHRLMARWSRPTDRMSGKTAKFIIGLTKSDAEQWLDWLEANGHTSFGLSCSREGGFTVWFK